MAVTEQVVGLVAVRVFVVIVHPEPDALYVTVPVPEPPDVVRVTAVPAIVVSIVFEIVKLTWVRAVKVKTVEADEIDE